MIMYMPSIFRDNFWDNFFGESDNCGCEVGFSKGYNELLRTDVKENEHDFELNISAPGIKKEDIKAEVNEGYLTVNVESKNEVNAKDEKSNFIRRERFYGKASRSFYVGDDVKTEDIKAKLENGVLTLNIPKVEKIEQKPEPKYISIE